MEDCKSGVPKTSLADQSANKIRNLILQGSLRPGEHINIDSLSKLFGVSKIPVREALKKLIAEGLAVYTPKVGYAVRNLTLHEYLQVSEIHQALELYLIKELAEMPFLVDTEALEELNAEIKAGIEAGDMEHVTEYNDKFHKKLYEKYPNQLFVERLADLWNEVRSLRNIMYNNLVFAKKTVKEHDAILQAIRKGKPEDAVRAMKRHYASGRDSAIISFPVTPV